MAVRPKTIALAAGEYINDSRCYLLAAGGDVYEAALHLPDDALHAVAERRLKRHSLEWTYAHLTVDCDEDSSLSCMVWTSACRSLFYQDRNGTLREHRFIDDQGWQPTGFQQPNVKIGTNIAFVSGVGPTQATLLFFQDVNGSIRCRTIEDGHWEDAVAPAGHLVGKGEPLTGVGAYLDTNTNDVSVYFQDESFAIREYRKHAVGGHWSSKGDLVTSRAVFVPDIVAAMPMIGGRHAVKLYLRDINGSIIEYSRTSSGWHETILARDIMRGASIAAVISPSSPFSISLMWMGDDQSLHLRGCHEFDGWCEPMAAVHFTLSKALHGKTAFESFSYQSTTMSTNGRSSVSTHSSSESVQSARGSWPPRSAVDSHGPTPNYHGYPGSHTPRTVASALPSRPASVVPKAPVPKPYPVVFNSHSSTSIPRIQIDSPGAAPRSPAPRLHGHEEITAHTTTMHSSSHASSHTMAYSATNGTTHGTAHAPHLRLHIPDGEVSSGAVVSSATAPRAIKRVCMHVNCRVDGLKLVYEDGVETAWSGTSTGREHVFVLGQGEYITHVWFATDGRSIQGLLFGTSSGRKSEWFGQEYGLYGLFSQDGAVLVGLNSSTQDGQLSTLSPNWKMFTPGGEYTQYLVHHSELEMRYNSFKLSVEQLKESIAGTAAGLQQLGEYEVLIAKAVSELVQNVEILQGLELESSTAKVEVTPLREKYHHNHLNTCKNSAEVSKTRFNELSAALAPLCGDIEISRETRRMEGEELLIKLTTLRTDIQSLLRKLSQQATSTRTYAQFWASEADRASAIYSEDKKTFSRISHNSGSDLVRLNQQGATSWGLQQWFSSLEASDIEDERAHFAASQILKSGTRMQLCASQAEFFQQHERLVSAHSSQIEQLQFDHTVSTLQSQVRSLETSSSTVTAIKGVHALTNLVDTAVALLARLQAANSAQAFARTLVDVLEALLQVHNFDSGGEDIRKLLGVCREIANRHIPLSPSYAVRSF